MVPHPAKALGSSITSSGVELYLSVVDLLPLKVPEACEASFPKICWERLLFNIHIITLIPWGVGPSI